MHIIKKKLADLPAVYVTEVLSLRGRRYLAVASENRGEKALIFDADTLEMSELWQGDTGVMNIVQIPGTEKVLCITRFYPVFQSKEAIICLLEPTENGILSPWKISHVLDLPFCHRIGIVSVGTRQYLLGSTLCKDKEFQEDWSQPGAIYTAPIPESPGEEWKLTQVFGGLTKNHGLFIEDGNQVYIATDNGLMLFDFSSYEAGETLLPRLLTTTPTSDLAVAASNKEHPDGDKLIVTIEPFHGDLLGVYSCTEDCYAPLTTRPISFGHAVWVGDVFGQRTIIVGNRGDEKTLEMYRGENMEKTVIDRMVGPTQISVYEEEGTLRILSANHGAGEVALYTLTR